MTTPPPSPSYYRPDVPRRDEVALAKPTADSEGLRANRRRLTLTLDASPAAPPIMPMEPDVATPAPDAVPAPMATEPPAPDRQEAPPPIAPESDASELADAAEAVVVAGANLAEGTPGAASVDSDDEELGSVFEAAGARLRGILLTGPVYTEEVYAAVQLEGTTYEERVASLWGVLKQNSRRRG